jgi:hypothetical protein
MSLTKVSYSMINGAPVNVLDYGAKGDGTTDDTAAFTAALATGKSVYVPQGTYKVAPVSTPVGGIEPNRTSAWILTSGQTIYGDGVTSVLLWGSATVQCFFKATTATNIALRNLKFVGGYSSIIVFPDTDGSVDGVTVSDCYFNGLLIDVIGGNQFPINSNSKYSKNVLVQGCISNNVVVHAILFTNCYNAQAIGNRFNNVTGGYCIDASQGSRNIVIANNVAQTCQYFCKIESSDPGAVNPTQWESHEVIIANNTARDISLYGMFVNTSANHVTIESNIMVGFTTHGIFLDQVSGLTYNGSISIADNILSASSTSTVACGILDSLSNGTLPHVFTGNVIDRVYIGIQLNRKNAVITGGSISASSTPILLNVPSVLDGVCITGVKMTGAAGINCNGTGQPVKRITVNACDINFTSFGIYSQSSIYQSIFNNNTLNSSAPTVGGIVLETPINCSLQNNTINMNTSTYNSITTATSTTDCIIVGNISNRAFNINAPSAGTINSGNIVNAAYVA